MAMLSVLLAVAGLTSVSSVAQGASILFVGKSWEPSPAGDDQVVADKLVSWGHTVTKINEGAATAADTTGVDLIMISSTVSSGNVAPAFAAGGAFHETSIGVMSWEQGLHDDMGFVPASGGPDGHNTAAKTTQLTLTTAGAAHPLGAGVSTSPVVVYSTASNFYGRLLPLTSGAVVIGGFDALGAEIASLDVGALRADNTAAPSRRVISFLTDTTAKYLTDDGWKLFQNEVNWTIVPEPGTLSLMGLAAMGLLVRRRR